MSTSSPLRSTPLPLPPARASAHQEGSGEEGEGCEEVVCRIWRHWREVAMAGRPTVPALTASRRTLILRALVDWGCGEEMLLMAIEGAASNPFNHGANRSGCELLQLSDILASEDLVERHALRGQRVRIEVERLLQRQAQAAQPPAGSDAQAEQARRRLTEMRRDMALRMAQGRLR